MISAFSLRLIGRGYVNCWPSWMNQAAKNPGGVELKTQAQQFRDGASFVRKLLKHSVLSPGASRRDDWLSLGLAHQMEMAAARLDAWIPPKLLWGFNNVPIAALKEYVLRKTGEPHYREIAELIAAARYASGLAGDFEEIPEPDTIRHRGENVAPEDIKVLLGKVEQLMNQDSLLWS